MNWQRHEAARRNPCPRCHAPVGEQCRRMSSLGPRFGTTIHSCHDSRLALAEFRRRIPGGHTLVTLELDSGAVGVTIPGTGTGKGDLVRYLVALDAVSEAVRNEIAALERQEELLNDVLNAGAIYPL
jgi:hypothetical protein